MGKINRLWILSGFLAVVMFPAGKSFGYGENSTFYTPLASPTPTTTSTSRTPSTLGEENGSDSYLWILTEQEFAKLHNTAYRMTVDARNLRTYYYFHENSLLVQHNFGSREGLVLDTLSNSGLLLTNLYFIDGESALLMWDAGGGRVFRYDLETRRLDRLDNSYSFRAFYGHADLVFPDDYRIYAYGGYGEFTSKNILIYYNQTNQEWVDIPIFGDVPTSYYYGDFEFDSEREVMLFVQYQEQEVVTYELSTIDWKWTKLGVFEVSSDVFHLDRFSGINRFDPVTGLMHIYWEYFYDSQTNTVRKYELREGEFTTVENLRQVAYDSVENRWVGLADLKGEGTLLSLLPFSLDLPDGTPRNYTVIEPKTERSPTNTYVFVLFLVVSGFVLVVLWGVQRLRKRQEFPVPSTGFIELQTGQVVVHCQGRRVVFSEELDYSFWEYVHELSAQGIQSCDLKEFDQQVLPTLSNESQYSTSRKKLLDHINAKLKVEFVQVRRSELDRRYRKIVFDHALIRS